uniref:Uncharacterized protein n=1 Tax=Asparagus officinalis TaxID=4686 RepID=Q2XNW5_ASPOF|nr:hypothetical protein 12.t00012 [Asparagus officinalis]
MTTPLGTDFFTDEEVMAQSDTKLTGTTIETLTVEFDQVKCEELRSSGSLSPKAMRKIHKVSKEARITLTDDSPNECLSLESGGSYSPSADEKDLAPTELVNRVENSILVRKNAARRKRRSLRRAQLRQSQLTNQHEPRVCEPQHDPELRVSTLEHELRVYVSKHEPRESQAESDPQWRISKPKRGP